MVCCQLPRLLCEISGAEQHDYVLVLLAPSELDHRSYAQLQVDGSSTPVTIDPAVLHTVQLTCGRVCLFVVVVVVVEPFFFASVCVCVMCDV